MRQSPALPHGFWCPCSRRCTPNSGRNPSAPLFMLRPIARRCRPQRHSFCPYHPAVQREALFQSMRSREEVSLAPCSIVAPQLAMLDSGRINRSGNMPSSRCAPRRSFTRFRTCNRVYKSVKELEDIKPSSQSSGNDGFLTHFHMTASKKHIHFIF